MYTKNKPLSLSYTRAPYKKGSVRTHAKNRSQGRIMPPSGLDFDDFVLEKVAFEARYRLAHLLWDRAGAISTKATKKWPKLEPKATHAEPSKRTTFRFRVLSLEAAV